MHGTFEEGHSHATTHLLLPVPAGDVLAHRVEALPVTVFNRLKRGQFSVRDELDLHGATAGQAETALRHLASQYPYDNYAETFESGTRRRNALLRGFLDVRAAH